MLKNYILVALRSLRRERLYAAINVIGMAGALTICLLVFAYVKHELSFDRFHANTDRLYRVNYLIPESDGKLTRSAGTAFVLAPILRERVPDIEAVVALADIPEAIVRYQNVNFREPIQFADSQFFSVFSFPLAEGNASTALLNPNSVVLSQQIARKYFGGEPALGKVMTIEVRGRAEQFEVTGVCEPVSGNSSLTFGIVVPLSRLYSFYEGVFRFEWNLTWPATYALLREGASPSEANSKLATLAKTLPLSTENSGTSLGIQPISEIHFDYAVANAPANASKSIYSYMLAGIAILVLALACINFTTLAIGRSQTRAKEVGIRKVMGARQEQVLGRFLGEAAVLCLLAVTVAFVLAELLLPSFNMLSGKQIVRGVWLDLWTLGAVIALICVTSLLAGGYPAVILAKTRLRDAVKGKSALLTGGAVTRTLIAVQFGISIALVIATLIMFDQLRYMANVPIGFDKEQLVFAKLSGDGDEKVRILDLLRNKLSDNADIVSVSGAGRTFDGTGMSNCTNLEDSSLFCVYANPADEYYVQTMGVSVVEGSNFTGSTLPDSLEPLLVNETLVRALKWDSPIGQQVPGLAGGRVIGVVNDFHYQSLVQPIEPLVIPYGKSEGWRSDMRYAYFRIKSGNLARALGAIEDAWKAVAPGLPFDFQFMDDHIDAQYRFEQRWWKIVSYSAILAILVACFGAFGLTALAVARRQKEIGVRKVLGASSRQIVNLLNREFFWLVAFGNLLAWPAAYYATHSWLEGFAYHVNLSIWPFVAAALLTVFIVILTVSAQAIRAARTNPVESLRYE